MELLFEAGHLSPPARDPKRPAKEAFRVWPEAVITRTSATSIAGVSITGELLRQIAAGVSRGACRKWKYDSGVFGGGRVMKKGQLYWKGKEGLCSVKIFRGQSLGLRASHDRYYEILYGPLVIGWFDHVPLRDAKKAAKPLLKHRKQEPVEMTLGGKRGNPKQIPLFPPTWKSLRDFPHSTGTTMGLYSFRRSTTPTKLSPCCRLSVTHVPAAPTSVSAKALDGMRRPVSRRDAICSRLRNALEVQRRPAMRKNITETPKKIDRAAVSSAGT